MLEQISFIHFAGMQNLWLVIVCACIAFFCIMMKWKKSFKALQLLSSVRLKHQVLLHASWIRRLCKYVLSIIGFISLFIALLQPEWNKQEELVEQEGRDILICVDISRSMLCADQKPNRLELAKQKVKKILCNLKCERVGLIVFAGDAVVQCPLTIDYAAFFMFLDNLDVATISSGTTSIDGALRIALSTFENMPERKTKIICLFTDGEDFSNNLAGLKDKAQKQKVVIFTFGIGSAVGAPIPIFDNQDKNIGFEKNTKGEIIMSKLNEGILRNLSAQTGGKYIHSSDDDTDVKKFINYVETFEKDSLGSQMFQKYQQQYSYFVAISFFCFGLEWLL